MLESLVNDILLIFSTFNSISLDHVPRNCKRAAQELARLNFNYVKDFEWSRIFLLESPP